MITALIIYGAIVLGITTAFLIHTKETPMKAHFEIKPPYVIFHDNTPGQHTILSVNGDAKPFHDGASSFDDSKKEYAWAFEGSAKEGDVVAFSADDRVITGVVWADGSVAITNPTGEAATEKPVKSDRKTAIKERAAKQPKAKKK